ncbi:MAG TPA: DUF2600 family protein [Solirubrobacteraceae bacterium]|nr:DUF2600 family protein [Solirubrobacteraceae bacterium]
MRSLQPQGVALARATSRELVFGLRAVSGEVACWRSHAAAIPDPELRAAALEALANKRGNIHGAALFWTLPDRRSRDLLELLVAYEILADYLDCVHERGASLGPENGQQLHLALVEALDPDSLISDYYRFHSSRNDGGYARALVERCRSGCDLLPSYRRLRPHLLRAAGLSEVLGLNHEPEPVRRDSALREWAAREWAAREGAPEEWPALEYPTYTTPFSEPSARARMRPRSLTSTEPTWFERTAGASAWLTALAMLALAAEPARAAPGQDRTQRTYDAYLNWIAPAGAMLDSFSDYADDQASGDHSYIAHYPTLDVAVQRVCELVRRSRVEARALPGGRRHEVLVACMSAFYLSKDSVLAPEFREGAVELRRAGGPLVGLLLPVLRLWRTAYGQRAA